MLASRNLRDEAERLIDRDDVLIYDACANVGQIVSNLPRRALVRIVMAFLEEG